MTNLHLEYKAIESGGEVRAGCEDSEWPEYENKYIEFSLTGCHMGDKFGRETVLVDFEPKLGQSVWVVYVIYNTGDSFGQTCGVWTILGVYETHEQAGKVHKSVMDGTWEGLKPWVGYFESFGRCETESIIVQG